MHQVLEREWQCFCHNEDKRAEELGVGSLTKMRLCFQDGFPSSSSTLIGVLDLPPGPGLIASTCLSLAVATFQESDGSHT